MSGQRPSVLVVIGTRPEGIKLAPVIEALNRRAEAVECKVALTGQHSDLMDQVIETFDIRPDWDLAVMREGQDLYDVVRESMAGLRTVFTEGRPDVVVAQGDTASVFTTGLVGFFQRVRVAHVEAGLRSHDKWRPWPEEIFRRLTGVVTDIHLAPTSLAAANLLNEGTPAATVHITGNTVVDALQTAAARTGEPASPALAGALATGRRIVLVTAHRRESFGEPLRRAFAALRELADRFADVQLLYPVHPNPNVREAAAEILSGHPRVTLCEPLGYLDLVRALRECALVITDSGGIQEEAPTFQKPVLVLRDVTERPEAVDAGITAVVGTDPDRITALGSAILEGHGWRVLRALREEERARTEAAGGRVVPVPIEEELAAAASKVAQLAYEIYPNPYGDGRAGERIADILVHELTGAPRTTEDWSGPA